MPLIKVVCWLWFECGVCFELCGYVNHMLVTCVLNYPEDGVPRATPKYNSSILEDMFLEDNAEYVEKTISRWKELGEALILLKV